MSRLVILSVLSVLLVDCAPEKKDDAPAPGPLISEIPKGCTFIFSPNIAQGSHDFNGQSFLATGFDCGVREGKTCRYYLAMATDAQNNPIEDVQCE